MKLSAAAFAILSLLGLVGIGPAAARGTIGSASGDVWNTAHVERLPREVRAAIERSAQACGMPITARHLFSRSIEDQITGDRFIALHFEEVHCVNEAAICTSAGCLHQVYVSKGGPYRLILNVHAPEIRLTLIDGSAAVEIDCGETTQPCTRYFHWDGSRLKAIR
jgi:hypothetical protein